MQRLLDHMYSAYFYHFISLIIIIMHKNLHIVKACLVFSPIVIQHHFSFLRHLDTLISLVVFNKGYCSMKYKKYMLTYQSVFWLLHSQAYIVSSLILLLNL